MKTKDIKKIVSNKRNVDVPTNEMQEYLLNSFGIKDYNKPPKSKHSKKEFRHD